MGKQRILILFVLLLSIILGIIFKESYSLTNEEILSIGEEKYLKFLWMVDGAFNESRMNGEYLVNNRKLDKNNKVFVCIYSNNNTCVSNNFYEEFYKLFSTNIKYEYVYGDGLTYSWIKEENNKFYFTNPNNCNINRMNLKQRLTIKEIHDKKIVYNINFHGNKKHDINQEFILQYENDDWKIVKAYYYDLCEMEYYIE